MKMKFDLFIIFSIFLISNHLLFASKGKIDDNLDARQNIIKSIQNRHLSKKAREMSKASSCLAAGKTGLKFLMPPLGLYIDYELRSFILPGLHNLQEEGYPAERFSYYRASLVIIALGCLRAASIKANLPYGSIEYYVAAGLTIWTLYREMRGYLLMDQTSWTDVLDHYDMSADVNLLASVFTFMACCRFLLPILLETINM